MSIQESIEFGLVELSMIPADSDVLRRARGVESASKLIAVGSDSADGEVMGSVGELRLERSRLLATLGHEQDAITDLTTVIEHFGDVRLGAVALLERARLHRKLADSDSAAIDIDRLSSTFAAATDSATLKAVAAGLLERTEWAAESASRAEESDVRSSWCAVVDHAEAVLGFFGDSPGNELELVAAEAMSWRARAWRTMQDLHDGENPSLAEQQAQRAADELFDRFARTSSADIRALVVASETEQLQYVAYSPRTALAMSERALTCSAEWGGEPVAFFANATVHRAEALAALDREQEAHDQLLDAIELWRGTDRQDVQIILCKASDNLVHLLWSTDHGDAALIEVNRFVRWLAAHPLVEEQLAARHALARVLMIKVTIFESRVDPGPVQVLAVNGTQVDSHADPQMSAAPTLSDFDYAAAVGEVLSRFAEDPDDGLRLIAAKAVQELAHHQRIHGQFNEAEDSYRKLIGQFAADNSSLIRENVLGSSELNLGFLLLSLLSRPVDALAVYDAAIERIGDPQSSHQRSLLGRLQSSRSAALTAIYDQGGVGKTIPADHVGAEERARIRAARTRASDAIDAKDYAAALTEYDSIIDAHPELGGQEIRGRVCDAMVRKGYCLGRLHLWRESVEHHHTMLALLGTDLVTTTEKDLALGLSNLATAFDHLSRHEEEIATYEQILKQWSNSQIPELIGRCAQAAWRKGVTEEGLGRTIDAERSYRRGLRYLHAEETKTKVEASKAAVNLSLFLRKRDRLDDAVATANKAIAALAGSFGDSAAEQRTKAHMALARANAQQGQIDAARIAYEWLLNDATSTINAEQRRTLTQEHLQLLGGPFKAVWHRIRRNLTSRNE